MVRPADLKRELFVVLLPDENLEKAIKVLQRKLFEYLGLEQKSDFPQLHITIDRIKKERVTLASQVIKKQAENFSQNIILKLDDLTCLQQIGSSYLVLKLKATASLTDFADQLHLKLRDENISSLENYNDWQFHITLINNHFIDHPISDFDFGKICELVDGFPQQEKGKASKIEIWRPNLVKKEKIAFSKKLI